MDLRLRVSALILGLFVGSSAGAANLIISDIDDTIKISHVMDKVDSASNANKWENEFLGMADVYRELAVNFPDAKIFYVTNAPSWLMKQNHTLFLKYGSFPNGELILRDNVFDSGFKLSTIKKLIKQWKPEEVILIGDNGESDTAIYNQVRKDHPSIKFFTHIHLPYSLKSSSEKGQPLEAGQVGFITSVDLAKSWLKLKFISEEQFVKLVEKLVPEILKEKEGQELGRLAFPAWLDCRGVVLRGVIPQMPVYSMELLEEYQQRLAQRCAGR